MDHEVYIQKKYNHPIQKVWDAITQKEQVEKWFMSVAAFDLKEGGEYHLTGKASDGWDGNLIGKVLEIDPPNKLVHTFKSNQIEFDTTVTWILKEQNDGSTLLTLTHKGVDKLSNKEKIGKSVDSGWMSHLAQLSDLLNGYMENG